MTNPYSPPPSFEPRMATDNRFYRGGFPRVALIALVIGTTVGLGLVTTVERGWSWGGLETAMIFGLPALGWMAAYFVVMLQVQSKQLSWRMRCFLALFYAFFSYILYVPVCSLCAGATTTVLGTNDYLPTSSGIIVSSAFAFLVLLLTFAFGIHVRMRPTEEPRGRE